MVARTLPASSVMKPPAPQPAWRLENGDRLTLDEFERRYARMPNGNKAELIEGVVYMPSPVRNSHNRATSFVTCWLATPGVHGGEAEAVGALLGGVGEAVRVESEEMVDMATALSGTGPAYVFLVMEALIDAGVHMGFPRRIAEELVLQTMQGSVQFARESGLHPAELRNMVTSPGGTTAAALYQMEKGSLRTVISRAVWAAYQRTVELGQPAAGPAMPQQ